MKRPGGIKRTAFRSRALARGSGPRPAPIDRRRKPRTRSEFARIYGSRKRVAWVKAQPCCVGSHGLHAGPIENAHVRTGGMGRKADAATIVPLCSHHHHTLHQMGTPRFENIYSVDLVACAEATERAWLAAQAAA